MISRLRSLRDDERGATLAVAAVMLFSLLAFMSLSYDLVILRVAHTEAQRAADSAALAGASAFLDFQPLAAVGPAQSRALDYATRNFIRNTQVDTPSVQVQVNQTSREVWVQVERQNVPTWFARFFGEFSKPVKASATAHATEAGGVTCMRALAIPDYWHDTDNDTNNDWIWDPNEDWDYDPTVDYYAQFNSGPPAGIPDETGFGSDHRDLQGSPLFTGDRGRRLVMKPQDPHQAQTPGYFYPLDLGAPGGGANQYHEDMTDRCGDPTNPNLQLQTNVGDQVNVEMGNMVGKTTQFVLDLYNMDPGAHWDATAQDIVGSAYGNPKNSPRMVLLGIFEPGEIAAVKGGQTYLTVKDFAYFFVEGHWDPNGTVCTQSKCKQDPVVGRFMYFANGVGGPGPTGNLTLTLELIK